MAALLVERVVMDRVPGLDYIPRVRRNTALAQLAKKARQCVYLG